MQPTQPNQPERPTDDEIWEWIQSLPIDRENYPTLEAFQEAVLEFVRKLRQEQPPKEGWPMNLRAPTGELSEEESE